MTKYICTTEPIDGRKTTVRKGKRGVKGKRKPREMKLEEYKELLDKAEKKVDDLLLKTARGIKMPRSRLDE